MNDESSNQDGYIKIAVAIVSALLVSAIGQGIVVWRDNSVLSAGLEDLRSAVDTNTNTLRVIAEQSSENSVHRIEHERQADFWINRIEQNTRELHALQRQPSARPDPFTGTEGRELERRIRVIEELTNE
jgi:hypothetical protein